MKFLISSRLSLVAIFLLAIMLGACRHKEGGLDSDAPSNNAHLNALLAEADTLFEQEKFEEALTAYHAAVDQFPREPAAFVARGKTHLALEAYSDAQADFNYAINLDESFAPAYLERGNLFRIQEDYQAAAVDYDHALDLNSQFSAVYVERGIMHELQGDAAAAFQSYGDAIQLDNQNARAHEQRGILLFSVFDDDTSALADFNRAVEIDGTDMNALLSRAFCYVVQEDWSAAQDDINQAFALGSNAARAYVLRAMVNRGLGNTAGVLQDLDQAAQIDPDFLPAYMVRMFHHLEQGNGRAAFDDSERIIAMESETHSLAFVYYLQGVLYETEFAEYLNARDAYEKAVNLAPDDFHFNFDLATLYNIYLQDFERAIVYYTRAIELDPGYADAYWGRGAAYYQLGIPNDERAISDFGQYIRLAGDSDPQKFAVAQQSVDQLAVTSLDIFLEVALISIVESLSNPLASGETESPRYHIVRDYYNPRTGGYQSSYCQGCRERAISVPDS